MSTISTHVLDTARGRPAAGVHITLKRIGASTGTVATTDADGRVAASVFGPVVPGTYRLRFDTAAYFAASGTDTFYPEVDVVFRVTDESHHHVPLLLSPFGYSTYRGS